MKWRLFVLLMLVPLATYAQSGMTPGQRAAIAAAIEAASTNTIPGTRIAAGSVPLSKLAQPVVVPTDPRLSDARTPLAHSHTSSDVIDMVETNVIVLLAPPVIMWNGPNVTNVLFTNATLTVWRKQ